MTEFLIRNFVRHAEDTADPAVRTRYGKLSGTVGILVNTILFGVKLAIGL